MDPPTGSRSLCSVCVYLLGSFSAMICPLAPLSFVTIIQYLGMVDPFPRGRPCEGKGPGLLFGQVVWPGDTVCWYWTRAVNRCDCEKGNAIRNWM